MDKGRYEELLARGGIYADLYRLQFEDGKAIPGGRNSRALRAFEQSSEPAEPNLLQRLGLRLFG